MSYNSIDNINMNLSRYKDLAFCANNKTAVATNPIDKLAQKVDEEKKKKHNKTAIAVGSSVVMLSLLVTILNPKMSSKWIEKLRATQAKANRQLERSKGDLLKSKFYKVISDIVNAGSKFMSMVNNLNSVKDTYYKQLCTEDKAFLSVHNMNRRKQLAKVDKVFRKIMQKPHEAITRWGDILAKKTVTSSYKSAGKKMDNLEKLIRKYSDELPVSKRNEINELLSQATSNRQFFTQANLDTRFAKQENLMKNLNNDIRNHWSDYTHGFRNKYVKNSEHIHNNLSFWAQDLMQADRDIIEKEGKTAVDKLFGNKDGLKGTYRELIEKLSDNLAPEEKGILEKACRKTEKSLRNANKNECGEYFDKKRDLILGSAPTDILSSAIFLGLGGVALASANDRDKRISRLITKVFPVIAGLGTNIVLTTMLFSGSKSLLLGIGASIVLSLIGSKIDKIRLAAKNKTPED